jgi:selenocysteine-specific elongation factor
MQAPRHFIIATAGHVDHGKSALVRALTGTDPDRLPEEKARGITIDLGFAHLELTSAAPECSSFSVGIIDVPGHEDFVKNMVAGVGSIDLALFVVSADDGWMPQTEEHLQILAYLGVRRAVVALTKVDLVRDEEAAILALRGALRDTRFADSQIVPTSTISGTGIADLKRALSSALLHTPVPRDVGKPRLPVDRVFTLLGIGTVITGTLSGGTLRRGQDVIIQPAGKTAKIRNVQSHNANVECGTPGTRIALNLPSLNSDDVRRGDVVTVAGLGSPTDTLDVLLEISTRARRIIKNGARVRMHHGSCSVAAQITFFTQSELSPGESALAHLRLAEPDFCFIGDRFILRDSAEQATLGGGAVLDLPPQQQSLRDALRLNDLQQRAQTLDDVNSLIISYLARHGAVNRADLLLQSRFSTAEISEAVLQLARGDKLVVASDFVVDVATWNDLRRRATEAVDARHRENPEQIGLPLPNLRKVLEPHLPNPDLLDALLEHLCAGDFVQAGNSLRRASHQPQLPMQLRAAAARITTSLASKPFDPPSRKDLAPDPISQQALRYLLQTGELTEINAELVMSTRAVKQAIEAIEKRIRDEGPVTASQLRQTLGTTRRIIIPFLEKLDREGITLRSGDTRTLRR